MLSAGHGLSQVANVAASGALAMYIDILRYATAWQLVCIASCTCSLKAQSIGQWSSIFAPAIMLKERTSSQWVLLKSGIGSSVYTQSVNDMHQPIVSRKMTHQWSHNLRGPRHDHWQHLKFIFVDKMSPVQPTLSSSSSADRDLAIDFLTDRSSCSWSRRSLEIATLDKYPHNPAGSPRLARSGTLRLA